MTGYATSYTDCQSVSIRNGDTRTCTITNSDIPAQLVVNIACDPTSTIDKFNLQIDSTTRQADAACGETTGMVYVNAGTHSVGETSGTGTTLTDYITAIGGACTSGGSITLSLGQAATCTITNIKKVTAGVVGQSTRTIGFWKNWSSVTGGGQTPKLDQTLAAAETAGISIGNLVLHGSASRPNAAPDAAKAVNILNKSTIDGRKKMASDPAFNLAAQLLAAKLNVQAGARVCPAAVSAINDAQSVLAAVAFNGLTHGTMTTVQANRAHSLATALDQYNNDNTLLCAAP